MSSEAESLPAVIDAEYSVIPDHSERVTGTLKTAESLVKWMSSKCKGESYISNIKGKQYPKVEWWTTVGAALGLFPFEKSSHRIDRDQGYLYESVVEIRRGGMPVACASAICSTDEKSWGSRDEYAIRSMATTRATAKAFRLGLSFLAVMANLEATPAEEVPPSGFDESPQGSTKTPAKEVRRAVAPAPAKDGGQGGVYVINTEEYSPADKDWTKYNIEFSDGTKSSTFDATLYALAQECQYQQKMVDPRLEQKGKYTNLVGLDEVNAPLNTGDDVPNPVETEINHVETKNNAGGGVNYVATTAHGRFGTSDAELGGEMMKLEGERVSITWEACPKGMKATKLLALDDIPF